MYSYIEIHVLCTMYYVHILESFVWDHRFSVCSSSTAIQVHGRVEVVNRTAADAGYQKALDRL